MLKRRSAPRERSRTLMKRSSYATLLVEESLERIEEDEQAMAAARTKRRDSESSTSLSQLQGAGKKESKEPARQENTMKDYVNVRNAQVCITLLRPCSQLVVTEKGHAQTSWSIPPPPPANTHTHTPLSPQVHAFRYYDFHIVFNL